MAVSKYDERAYQVQAFSGVASVYEEANTWANTCTQRCEFEKPHPPSLSELTDGQRSSLRMYISQLENKFELEIPESLQALYRQIIHEEASAGATRFFNRYKKTRIEVVQSLVGDCLQKHKRRADFLKMLLGNDPVDALWDAVELSQSCDGPPRAQRGQEVNEAEFRAQMKKFSEAQKHIAFSSAPVLPVCPAVQQLALAGRGASGSSSNLALTSSSVEVSPTTTRLPFDTLVAPTATKPTSETLSLPSMRGLSFGQAIPQGEKIVKFP